MTKTMHSPDEPPIAYYLLTAYSLMGKDTARNKMTKKYKGRLLDVL
jgi:hypothetical protein